MIQKGRAAVQGEPSKVRFFATLGHRVRMIPGGGKDRRPQCKCRTRQFVPSLAARMIAPESQTRKHVGSRDDQCTVAFARQLFAAARFEEPLSAGTIRQTVVKPALAIEAHAVVIVRAFRLYCCKPHVLAAPRTSDIRNYGVGAAP